MTRTRGCWENEHLSHVKRTHHLVPCGMTDMLPSTESVIAFSLPVLMVTEYSVPFTFNKWHSICSF